MFIYKIGDDAELRLLEDHYAQDLFARINQNRDYLHQWMPWVDPVQSVNDVRTFIHNRLIKFAEKQGMEVGIWYENQLAGVISYNILDLQNKKAVVGYWVGQTFQGKGLVTRACRAMVDHAFHELNLNRVELECATENLKSQAIPERLGFKKEGLIRQAEWLYDHYVDHFLYGLLASEWQQDIIATQEHRSLEPA